MHHALSLMKPQWRSHSRYKMSKIDKLDIRRRNSGRKCGNLDNVERNPFSTIVILQQTAFRTPTTPTPVPILHQQHTRKAQSNSPPSTTTVEDALFDRFCLAASHPTTQWSAIQPQLRARLINICKSNLPTLARENSTDPAKQILRCSPPPAGNSTTKALQPSTTAKNHSPARQRSPSANQTFSRASRTQPAAKP